MFCFYFLSIVLFILSHFWNAALDSENKTEQVAEEKGSSKDFDHENDGVRVTISVPKRVLDAKARDETIEGIDCDSI